MAADERLLAKDDTETFIAERRDEFGRRFTLNSLCWKSIRSRNGAQRCIIVALNMPSEGTL
ncbi:hypothetical protein ATY30_27070 [Sinorhizobium americanum]|nr:hypothetical protein CO664_22720 [Sinorhizobium sp. NG07B]POH25835.1 hypothetical protein ATY30_27070 [Sinorhizobium americanum]